MKKEKRTKNLCWVCGKPVREFEPETGGTGYTEGKGHWHFTCMFPEKKEEIYQKNRSKFNEEI